jgi:hypothetical protein
VGRISAIEPKLGVPQEHKDATENRQPESEGGGTEDPEDGADGEGQCPESQQDVETDPRRPLNPTAEEIRDRCFPRDRETLGLVVARGRSLGLYDCVPPGLLEGVET